MESFLEYIKQRSVSTYLVSYTVFWAIYHWEGVYTTLFTSQDFIMDRYGLLKNEYVHRFFFGILQDNFWSWIGGIIVPGVLAFIYVYFLPKILINPLYKKEIKYKVDREEMKIKEEKRLVVEERKKVEEQVRGTDARIELDKKRVEIEKIDPEVKWERDYRGSVDDNAGVVFGALTELRTVIYTFDGYIEDGEGKRIISEDSLMFCDVNELIKISHNQFDRSNVILTEKGKYFLKEFAKEQIS